MKPACHSSFALDALEPRTLLAAAYPTAYEQYMVALINRARANPSAEAARFGIALNEGLAAGTISTAVKQPLAINPYLTSGARAHTQWMSANNLFQHAGAGGSTPQSRMAAAGYSFSGSWGSGENIAWYGQTGGAPNILSTTASLHEDLFVDSGIPGRGHRLNILEPDFKELGAGVFAGPFTGYNAVLTTEDFAYSSGNSFLTGAAYADTVTADSFYTPGEGLGAVTIQATRLSDSAVFSTTTWTSGGYSLRLPAGTYSVVASGTGLGTVTRSNIIISSQNVAADFTPAAVTKVGTSTVVTSSNAAPSPGQAVTLTATVTPASGSGQTGTIQFRIDGSNAGSPVALSANKATYTTSTLALGSHSVVAIYSGDGSFAGSTSPTFTQHVVLPEHALGVGRFNDAAYSSNGTLHVAWYDPTTQSLKYASRGSGGAWSATTTIDSAGDVGTYVSLAVGASNRPAVTYYDATNADLKYASFDGSNWQVTTIDSVGRVGMYPSLAFDGSNLPSVTYYDRTHGDLKIASFTGSAWQLSVIDSVNDCGRYSSLAMNPGAGRWAVAYEQTTNGLFRYGQKTKAGWSLSTVDDTQIGGGYISLAFAPDNTPAFSYYDAYNADLKAARYNKAWIVQTLATKNTQGLYTNSVVDAAGVMWSYYYHKSADQVVCASSGGGVWAFSNVKIGGGTHLSLAASANLQTRSIVWLNSSTGQLVVSDVY